MKLAFCIFKFFAYGGLSRDFMKLGRECIARGHDVRVYALWWNAPVPDDIEVIEVSARGLSNPARYRRFAAWVQDHLESHPVDLVVGLNKMPGLDVYYAGDSCFEEKARTQRGWHYRLLPRYRHFASFEQAVFGAERPVKILTITEAQKPAFKRYYATPEERFFLLPPGIEQDRLEPEQGVDSRRWLRREFILGDDDLVLLFVGSGFVKKGVDRMLAAMAALPTRLQSRTHLLILGEDKAQRFERLASGLGLGDRVRFLGGRDDVFRFLHGADAFLLPAYDEAGGIVILEAIAAGLPALVTDVCGYAPYVAKAGAGIVSASPFDQRRFNDELVRILTSAERETWRRNGRRLGASGELTRLVPTACDLIEKFARGEVQPTIAFCLHRVAGFDGISRDFLKIAARCATEGFNVRVYTMSWEGAIPRGFDVVIVPVASMTDYKRVDRFEQWVNRALQRSPVHCVIGFNKMPGLDLYYAGEACREEEAQVKRTRLYRSTPRFKQLIDSERAVFDGTTKVVVQSERQREIYAGYYDADLALVAPYVDRSLRRPANADEMREDFRGSMDFSDADLVLLTVGGKGVDRVLMAIGGLGADLKDRIQLLDLGGGGLSRMANGLGLGGHVRFMDPQEDILPFYLGADLLLHLAYVDLAAHVVLEAVVAGLPVLTTDEVGYSEHVALAGAGRVLEAPFELEAFKRALVEAITDDELRRSWSERGASYGTRARVYDMPSVVTGLIREQVDLHGRALSAR